MEARQGMMMACLNQHQLDEDHIRWQAFQGMMMEFRQSLSSTFWGIEATQKQFSTKRERVVDYLSSPDEAIDD